MPPDLTGKYILRFLTCSTGGASGSSTLAPWVPLTSSENDGADPEASPLIVGRAWSGCEDSRWDASKPASATGSDTAPRV